MQRLIQLVRIPELNPLPVMNRVFSEFSGAFADYCSIKTVYTLSDLQDGGIVLLDNAAGRFIHNKDLYQQIGQRCPNSIFICWYWEDDTTFQPFQHMIYTGEYHLYPDRLVPHRQAYLAHPHFVPLKLRADDSPSKIGTYSRSVVRDYCYMGGGYKMDWIPPAPFTGLYHQVIYDNYLSYEERRTIYLSSTFALGFQGDENIRTGHLSQRLFEGLAYGCVVFCENPLASEFTNGIIVHVTSREDLWDKMRDYQSHPEWIQEKQKAGYEWVKQYGTNRMSAQLFLDRIKTLWNMEFGKPIVSVNIMGGLGNQLFEIASAYAYAQKEGGQLQIVKKMDNGNRPVYWNSVLYQMKPYLVSSLPDLPQWSESLPTMYRSIGPLPSNGLYLNGYLQSSKYFYNDSIKQSIRQLFAADPAIMIELSKTYSYLLENKDRVVVVHARRTDYLKNQTMIDCHGPLSSSYYKEAIQRMKQKVENPIWLLTSDDNRYWIDIEQDLGIHAPIILMNETDIKSFALLQQFNHYIMANSTFIWWCVYLADAKQVIAPSKWFGPAGPHPYDDIYEAHWERI